MKHHFFKNLTVSYLLFFGSIPLLNAQEASGNFTFQSDAPQTNIQATATSLFANDAHEYNISGNTNENIPFGPYKLDKSMSVQQFFNTDKNHIVFGNGSNFLNAYVTGNDAKAIVYDVNGRVVGHPQTSQVQDNIMSTKMDMSTLPNGVYIVQVRNANNVNGFKFLKTNKPGFRGDKINTSFQPSKSLVNTSLTQQRTTTKAKSSTQTSSDPNYNISWNEQVEDVAGKIITTQAGNQEVTLEDITNNEITIPISTKIDYTGDVAVAGLINATVLDNIKVTITNLAVPDSTYTKIFTDIETTTRTFKNIHVRDATNPDQYEITIIDNRADGTFLETKEVVDIYHDNSREINGTKIINLNEIPDEQNITFNIFHYKNLTPESNVNFEVLDKTTGNVIDTGTSNANGEVTITVPGEGEYLTRTSKTGHYTKTVGSFITPKVDLVSEMEENYNTTTIPIQFYSDGEVVTAEQASKYKLLAVNTELLHARWNKYLPESGSRDNIINRLNHVVKELGFEGAITYFNTPFTEPTEEQIDNYRAYEANLPYGNDKIGSNVEYSGSDNSSVIRTNGNNPNYTFNTSTYQLGPNNSTIDHELLQVIGFQQIAQGSIIPQTALDPTGPSELSMYDGINTGMKLQIAKNHFVNTYNSKPVEYNYKTLILKD